MVPQVLSASTDGVHPGTIYKAKVIQVQLVAGTYYLGAIVDDTSVVDEVDEQNNAQVQTDASGVASSTVLSAQSGEGRPSAKGGGSLGLFSLFLLLLSIAAMLRRRGVYAWQVPVAIGIGVNERR